MGTAADSSPYAITIAATLTIVDGPNDSGANNNGGTTEFVVDGTVGFDVVITNPCTSAAMVTIDALVFTVAAPAVTDGGSTTTEWDTPKTSVDTTLSTSAICGSTSFAVYTDNDGTDTAPSAWAVISAGSTKNWMLTLNTSLDLTLISNEASITHTLYIKSTLDDWSVSEYDAITVTIGEAECDCSYLVWSSPTTSATEVVFVESALDLDIPVPTPDSTTNQAIYPAFEKCYLASLDCTENGRFDSISDLELDGATLIAD